MMLLLVPFRDPFAPGIDHWYLMLLPLAFGVALVYKAIRVPSLTDVPRQTLRAFVKFIVWFVALALVLWLIVLFLERAR